MPSAQYNINEPYCEIPGGGTEGYHVMRVLPESPASDAKLKPFFDFIIKIGNTRLDRDIEKLKDILESNDEKELQLTVFNSKTIECRQVTLKPSKNWGDIGINDSLLGATLRYAPFNTAKPYMAANKVGRYGKKEILMKLHILAHLACGLVVLINLLNNYEVRFSTRTDQDVLITCIVFSGVIILMDVVMFLFPNKDLKSIERADDQIKGKRKKKPLAQRYLWFPHYLKPFLSWTLSLIIVVLLNVYSMIHLFHLSHIFAFAVLAMDTYVYLKESMHIRFLSFVMRKLGYDKKAAQMIDYVPRYIM